MADKVVGTVPEGADCNEQNITYLPAPREVQPGDSVCCEDPAGSPEDNERRVIVRARDQDN